MKISPAAVSVKSHQVERTVHMNNSSEFQKSEVGNTFKNKKKTNVKHALKKQLTKKVS